MKFPLILSAILLVVFGLAGWKNQTRLDSARETHARLVSEADALGIPAGSADPTATSARRERPDRDATARSTATDFLELAREFDRRSKAGSQEEEPDDLQDRVLSIMDRIAALDAEQIKTLIAIVNGDSTITNMMRQGLINFAIMTLAEQHPRKALELFTASSDLLPDGHMAQRTLSSALSRWAEESPEDALAWLRQNQPKFPELIDENTKASLLTGVASTDPAKAILLARELGLESPDAFGNIARTLPDDRKRTDFLQALRENMKTFPAETRDRILESVFANIFGQSPQQRFGSLSAWFDSTDPSPAEIEAFSKGLALGSFSDIPSKIDWIASRVAPDKQGSRIQHLVRQWATADYQATGKWLVSMPDGPSKNHSVRAYAETVAPYEPATAEQWALTLPAGKDRTATLRTIFRQWPESDPEGAAAFAAKHGLK